MTYYLYNVPYLGTLLKRLVNQKDGKGMHTHGYNDLIKVVITTLSIILFNIEDTVDKFYNFRGHQKTKAMTS